MPQLPPGHPPMSGSAMAGMGMPPTGSPLQIKAPEGWVAVQPKTGMIQAEFALPKVEGDENDGRLTVMIAGGTVEANVDRWRRQFDNLEAKPTQEIDVSGTKVILVDLSGTYKEGGMMGPMTLRPNYRMLAAIILKPDRQIFVKAYGPKNTIAKYTADFRTFAESLASPASAKPAPPESARPSPAENAKPAPAQETKPAPTEEAKSAPTENAKPAPAEETKTAPAEETKPAPAENANPAPAKDTKPAPAEETKPAPTENAKPAPDKDGK